MVQDFGEREGEQWPLAQKKIHRFLVVKHQKIPKIPKVTRTLFNDPLPVIIFGILGPVAPAARSHVVVHKYYVIKLFSKCEFITLGRQTLIFMFSKALQCLKLRVRHTPYRM